jgi:hypothetical protein
MSVNFHQLFSYYNNSTAEPITFHSVGGIKDYFPVSGSSMNWLVGLVGLFLLLPLGA